MFRTSVLCGAVLLGGGLVLAQVDQTGNPPGHHPRVEAPDPLDEGPAPPVAKAEDVESMDAIIAAFYDSISGAKGEARDWDRLRSLFKPAAQMIAARPTEDGAGLWALKLDDFIGLNERYFVAGGYYESEVSRIVESYGNIAHAWSTYEARKVAEAPVAYARGIYSIQLLKDGDRWWIVNMYWDFERTHKPIPEKYLGE